MSNSLRITGPWEVRTPSTSLPFQKAACSISCLLRFNAFGNGYSGTLFGGDLFQVFMGQQFAGTLNAMPLAFGAGYPLYYQLPFQIGTVYHVALVWNAAGTSSIYVNNYNGTAVQTAQSALNSTSGGASYLKLGFFDQTLSTIDYQISNLAVWGSYALTSADVIALRNQTSTPMQIGSGSIAWWTLSGTPGATPAFTDAGFQDHGNAGLSYTSFFSGSAANAVYAAPLVYVPPTAIVPYVAKSGKMVPFFATATGSTTLQNITAVAQDPTIQVQWGGSGALHTVSKWGPLWAPSTNELPFAMYQIACGPVESVVVQNRGHGYSSSPSASASGGGGSGCTLGTPVVMNVVKVRAE